MSQQIARVHVRGLETAFQVTKEDGERIAMRAAGPVKDGEAAFESATLARGEQSGTVHVRVADVLAVEILDVKQTRPMTSMAPQAR